MFTDIVDSTQRASSMGDRAWRDLLDAQNDILRRQLARFRGREIKTLGDGMLATFDGPARAIRCALAITEAVRPLGIEVRVGLHTGEVELVGDPEDSAHGGGDVAGIAVHIAARVGAKAGTGEVLVSGTVKDLVAGSGIAFADRGEHILKGIPDQWRLFAVEA
jgi:class 3 adenylate cyclase